MCINGSYRIGRITEGFLLGIATTVDIVEPIAKFTDNLKGKEGVGKIFNIGLGDWSPEQSSDTKYDLIWNQWCLGHLTDAQLQTYLEKCAKALVEGGLVVVKENLSTSGEDRFDELDSCVTRYVVFSWWGRGERRFADVRIGVIRNSGIFLRRRG